MEGDGDLAEAGGNELSDRGLDGLLSQGGRGCSGLVGRAEGVHKRSTTILVVGTDSEFSTTSAAHNVSVDLFSAVDTLDTNSFNGATRERGWRS